MTKKIYVCDKCKSEFTVDGSLYNIAINNSSARIHESFEICHFCFKDLIKLIRYEDSYVFTIDELKEMERSSYEKE